MAALFSLIPHEEPSFDALPGVTVAQVDQLRTEVTKAGTANRPLMEQARTVASLLRGGEPLYWSFATPWDALACARYGKDPRCPLPGTPVDVVRLDAEPLLEDGRYLNPDAASLVTEVPHLAPAEARRWLEHALYRGRQSIVRLTATPDPDTTVRVPADLLLQRCLTDVTRRANTPSERQRLRTLPRELSSWTPRSLANCGTQDDLYRAGVDLFSPPRRRGKRRHP